MNAAQGPAEVWMAHGHGRDLQAAATAPVDGAALDAVVVGAGLSGLICARALRRHGLRVQLLEAADRCGGRMHSQASATGLRLDLGGQWVGASHTRLQALLAEYGLRLFPTFYAGEGVFHWNGRAMRAGIEHDFRASFLFFRPAELALPAAELARALALQAGFAELVDQLDGQAPWALPGAQQLDQGSIAAWLERRGASELEGYPLAWLARLGGSGGYEPGESSLLHLAWTQAVAPQHETPEAWLVEGGIAQLGHALAAELAPLLRLRCPVHAIQQAAGTVRLQTAAGELRAAAAVVAIPPPLRQRIRFEPPLPAEQQALLAHCAMGSMVKVLALYRRPFWRDQGLNGLGIGNLPFLELVVDASPPDGPGLLTGFIAAERAVRWQRLPEAERRRRVLADLCSFCGQEAADPIELVQHDWMAEPWSGGAFTSFLRPGTWCRFGTAWRACHGRVLWAGSEEAGRWPGYYEGAVEAGLRAADQVLALLR